jgi:hypothetical protein
VQKSVQLFSKPHDVRNRGGETLKPLQNAVKDVVYVYMPLLPLTYHALYTEGYDNRIQNGSHDYRGPANAQGSKVKPAR